MSVVIVTGSSGLIGSETASFYAREGMDVVGIDNDMRRVFFGDEASTARNRKRLQQDFGDRYAHHDIDIRDVDAIRTIYRRYGDQIALTIHTAAQPSHDWAARDPQTDFTVNANGTLNLLQASQQYAPDSVFIFTSTNKVYGDSPNRLPLRELTTRWEIDPDHEYAEGISETMSIDASMHSLFGASKVAADVLVQEYGRYFDLRTACFRGGCLTGPSHSGAQLHGFLSYLMKCAVMGERYTIFGYEGKQVRDNIHSSDLVRAFDAFLKNPRCGAVYNIGGGRHSNCSMTEAIGLCEQICQQPVNWNYADQNRAGDHIWWISDNSRFRSEYPDWELEYDVPQILQEIYDANAERWSVERVSAS